MNRRESLWLKFVRYWFGIDSKLDERQLSEVERIGNNAYVLLSLAEIIALFISFCFVFVNQISLAYWFLGLTTLIIILISNFYTTIALKKSQILQVEITPDERQKAVRRIYLKSIIEGAMCFIPCMIGEALGSSIANSGNLVNVLSFWPQGLFGSICISICTVTVKTRRLKVIKGDN